MKKGFTLIELLVVVLIIGILAAVALPQYQKAVIKSRLVQLDTTIDAYKKGISIWLLENGGLPSSNVDFTELDGSSNGLLSIDAPATDDLWLASFCAADGCDIYINSSKFELDMRLQTTDSGTWQLTDFSAGVYRSAICQWAKERFDYTCS